MIRSSVSHLVRRIGAPLTAPVMAAQRRVSERLGKLAREIGELRDAVRLTQAQVAALVRTVEPADNHQPVSADEDERARSDRRRRLSRDDVLALTAFVPVKTASESAGPDIQVLERCGVCGSSERTIVLEFNRFATLDTAPDEWSRQYDYAVCHGCGILYATRRPIGARYRTLVDGFQETLGRVQRGMPRDRQPILYPYPLTPEERDSLARRASAGVWQSEHESRPRELAMPQLWRDRLANAPHIELLSSLAPVRGATVLELRPRSGAIGAALRERFAATVDLLPLFESQAVIAESAYGHRVLGLLDYETFSVPGERTYDLVIGNHLLVHAVRPERFFQMLRDRLRPGGHIYVYNEPDDAEYLTGTTSVIRVLNAFHLQAFDRSALECAFAVNGFKARFLGHTDAYNLVLLAERVDEAGSAACSLRRVQERVAAYLQARLSALLHALPESKALVKCDWQALMQEAIARGFAELDADGRTRVRG